MIEANFTVQGDLLGLSSEVGRLGGNEITLDDNSVRAYSDGTTFFAVDTGYLYVLYNKTWYRRCTGLGGSSDGISVTNAFVNESGNLIITLSDGRKIDAGLVRDSSGNVSDGTVATDAEVEEMLDGIFNVN